MNDGDQAAFPTTDPAADIVTVCVPSIKLSSNTGMSTVTTKLLAGIVTVPWTVASDVSPPERFTICCCELSELLRLIVAEVMPSFSAYRPA